MNVPFVIAYRITYARIVLNLSSLILPSRSAIIAYVVIAARE
jgi:hypothetical protein